jgi:hypothetical protein
MLRLAIVGYDDHFKSKREIYEAPEDVYIPDETYVMVENEAGLMPGKLLTTRLVVRNADEYNFILAVAGQDKPLGKVVGFMRMLKYDNEEE